MTRISEAESEMLSEEEKEALSMECGCVYSGAYDSTGPDAFSEKIRKANKTHICTECGYEILKGDHYTHSSGIWEGTPAAYKTCSCCRALRDQFFCEGFFFGELWAEFGEYINDMHGEIPSSSLLELPLRARNRVFAMIEDIWQDINDHE